MSPATSRSLLALGLVVLATILAWWLFGDDGDAEVREVDVTGRSSESGGREPARPTKAGSGSGTVETQRFTERPDRPDPHAKSDDPFGSVRVVATWKDDKAPAARVGIRLIPWGGSDPFLHARFETTDDDGILVATRLRVGKVGVYGHLGGRESVEIEPGKESVVELEIPSGSTLRGVVVDPEGAVVEGATVFLSRDGSFTEGEPTAVSDDTGRFQIRGVEADTWRTIGARKAGYGPSAWRFLLGRGDKDVRIVLGPAGGGVSGTVVDAAGNPVPGARVEIGPRKHRQFKLDDGGSAVKSAQFIARTDEEGRFHVFGLAPGEVPALARAPGLAPWRGSVVIEPKRTRSLRIELEPGVVVEGRVLDAEGKPAAKVDVSVGGYGDFMTAWDRTDATGAFRLIGVAAGEIVVKADGEDRGKDETTLHASSGETRWWDARLKFGLKLRGRVIDGEGKPLAKWAVTAEAYGEGGEWDHKFLRTDAEGRFEAAGCIDAPYKLTVHKVGGGAFPLAVLKNQKPGGPEIIIRVENAHAQLGTVKGVVLGPDGPLPGVQVNAWPVGSNSAPVVIADADTGRFQLEKVPPGRYRVFIRANGYPRWQAPEYELKPGETYDVGTVRLETPGFVKLRVHRPAALIDVKIHGNLRREGHNGEYITVGTKSEGRSKPMTPGTWTLKITGDGVEPVERSVEVVSGEDTLVEVNVTPKGR